MKAIIVSIESGTDINILLKGHSKIMLPVANEPLISYLLSTLSFDTFDEVLIATEDARDEQVINDFLRQRRIFNKNIRWIKALAIRGIAGIIKDAEEFLKDSPFIVIDGNFFFNCGNLDKLLELESIPAGVPVVKVCVSPISGEKNSNIYLKVSPDLTVSNFSYDPGMDDTMYTTSGIYIFKPEIFRFIEDNGYVDIDEQLLPYLQVKGEKIYCLELGGFAQNVKTLEDYAQVNNFVLGKGMLVENNYLKQLSDSIWVGRNVKLNPGASLAGPLVIGDNCTIDRGANIYGPTCIGANSHIYEDALIRESIILNNTSVEKDTSIEHSIVNSGNVISPHHKLYSNIYVDGKLDFYDLSIASDSEYQSYNITCDNFLHSVIKYKFYQFLKRLLDIFISMFCITIFLPFAFLICLAIKLDSKGKVFYVQERCGLNGRNFKMIKFRTMVEDAEKTHPALVEQSDTDGPIFKLLNDPRITRVGRILRRTCVDEIPQFLNVFMGKMSLVGPRPLVAGELRFCAWWKEIRLKVKPGMTGLWQIKIGERHCFHEWIKSDLHYVRNQSFLLDLSILIKTFFAVSIMIIRR